MSQVATIMMNMIERCLHFLPEANGQNLSMLTIFFSLGLFLYFVLGKPENKKLSNRNSYSRNMGSSADEPDVLIVGSGVLGSAMAATLGRDGRRVTIIERDMSEPDRIVGELLQPGGFQVLKKLGLGDCVEGIDAHVTHGYIVHDRDTQSHVKLDYPLDNDKQIKTGRAFHHGSFIAQLRNAAKEQKTVRYIEATVNRIVEEDGRVVGVTYKDKQTDEIKEIRAPLTIIADGCFSRFRKHLVKSSTKVTSHFVGAIMKDCPQFVDHYSEVILTNPSPVLVYQIESHETRVLVDIRGDMPKDIKDYLLRHVHPQMPDHLRGPFKDGIENGRIRTMPNSFLPPAPIAKPGVLLLGDAFNMRHPLTGGGMTVAFSDVLMWHELLKDIPDLYDTEAMSKALQRFHWQRKNSHSFVVNVLAQALYELFAANDGETFHFYLVMHLNGENLFFLSFILTPRPEILIGHFFAVAFYAVYFAFKDELWWSKPRAIYNSCLIFYKACHVIFPLIFSELYSVMKYKIV
ncbi:squalene monooxygenase-like [Saccoglossus kowalevskii]